MAVRTGGHKEVREGGVREGGMREGGPASIASPLSFPLSHFHGSLASPLPHPSLRFTHLLCHQIACLSGDAAVAQSDQLRQAMPFASPNPSLFKHLPCTPVCLFSHKGDGAIAQRGELYLDMFLLIPPPTPTMTSTPTVRCLTSPPCLFHNTALPFSIYSVHQPARLPHNGDAAVSQQQKLFQDI